MFWRHASDVGSTPAYQLYIALLKDKLYIVHGESAAELDSMWMDHNLSSSNHLPVMQPPELVVAENVVDCLINNNWTEVRLYNIWILNYFCYELIVCNLDNI